MGYIESNLDKPKNMGKTRTRRQTRLAETESIQLSDEEPSTHHSPTQKSKPEIEAQSQTIVISHQPIPAPTFDGSTDVESFISTFEAIAQHNRWTPEEMLLRLQLALKGPACRGGSR